MVCTACVKRPVRGRGLCDSMPRGESPRMHRNLRAWRKFRKLPLTEVAAALGVSHSTVSRWETGAVPLTTADLENLAAVYGITRRQLEQPPDAAQLVAFLDRAQHVVESLSADDLERWITIGESLSRK